MIGPGSAHNKLRIARRDLGITVDEAATACGISPTFYRKIESGTDGDQLVDSCALLLIKAHGEPCPHCGNKVACLVSEPDPRGANHFVLHCGCLTPVKSVGARTVNEEPVLSPEEAVEADLAEFARLNGSAATTADRRAMADFLLAQAAAMLPMYDGSVDAGDEFLCVSHGRADFVGLVFHVEWASATKVRLSAEGRDVMHSIVVYWNSIQDPRQWERVS